MERDLPPTAQKINKTTRNNDFSSILSIVTSSLDYPKQSKEELAQNSSNSLNFILNPIAAEEKLAPVPFQFSIQPQTTTISNSKSEEEEDEATTSSPNPIHNLPISGGSKEQKESKRKPKLTMVIPEKYLLMRQTDAAYQLGFSPSTFSKRWRTSLPSRKWPYRKHSKVNNAIKALRAMQKKGHVVEVELEKLLLERTENCRPAVINYCDKDIMDRDSQALLAGRPSSAQIGGKSSSSSTTSGVKLELENNLDLEEDEDSSLDDDS